MYKLSAKRFAQIAHGDQKYGEEPYMVHLEAVASQFPDGSVEQDVAWLHDVLEDTKVEVLDLAGLFNVEIATAVLYVTRLNPEISYLDFIRSIKRSNNPTAIVVKIADNKANLAASGKTHLEVRYYKSLEILEGKEDV
tara:strand:+ start:402 stop:815 length:414 start_codon:yes stop_codon:yes gene_type:complete